MTLGNLGTFSAWPFIAFCFLFLIFLPNPAVAASPLSLSLDFASTDAISTAGCETSVVVAINANDTTIADEGLNVTVPGGLVADGLAILDVEMTAFSSFQYGSYTGDSAYACTPYLPGVTLGSSVWSTEWFCNISSAFTTDVHFSMHELTNVTLLFSTVNLASGMLLAPSLEVAIVALASLPTAGGADTVVGSNSLDVLIAHGGTCTPTATSGYPGLWELSGVAVPGGIVTLRVFGYGLGPGDAVALAPSAGSCSDLNNTVGTFGFNSTVHAANDTAVLRRLWLDPALYALGSYIVCYRLGNTQAATFAKVLFPTTTVDVPTLTSTQPASYEFTPSPVATAYGSVLLSFSGAASGSGPGTASLALVPVAELHGSPFDGTSDAGLCQLDVLPPASITPTSSRFEFPTAGEYYVCYFESPTVADGLVMRFVRPLNISASEPSNYSVSGVAIETRNFVTIFDTASNGSIYAMPASTYATSACNTTSSSAGIFSVTKGNSSGVLLSSGSYVLCFEQSSGSTYATRCFGSTACATDGRLLVAPRTATVTPSSSASRSSSFTASSSATRFPSRSASESASWTTTRSFSMTPTETQTYTLIPTPSRTETESYTLPPTPTASPTLSSTPIPTPTATYTDTPTTSPSSSKSISETRTLTSQTLQPTDSATSTPTHNATGTYSPTLTFSPNISYTVSKTVSTSDTPTRTLTATPSLTYPAGLIDVSPNISFYKPRVSQSPAHIMLGLSVNDLFQQSIYANVFKQPNDDAAWPVTVVIDVSSAGLAQRDMPHQCSNQTQFTSLGFTDVMVTSRVTCTIPEPSIASNLNPMSFSLIAYRGMTSFVVSVQACAHQVCSGEMITTTKRLVREYDPENNKVMASRAVPTWEISTTATGKVYGVLPGEIVPLTVVWNATSKDSLATFYGTVVHVATPMGTFSAYPTDNCTVVNSTAAGPVVLACRMDSTFSVNAFSILVDSKAQASGSGIVFSLPQSDLTASSAVVSLHAQSTTVPVTLAPVDIIATLSGEAVSLLTPLTLKGTEVILSIDMNGIGTASVEFDVWAWSTPNVSIYMHPLSAVVQCTPGHLRTVSLVQNNAISPLSGIITVDRVTDIRSYTTRMRCVLAVGVSAASTTSIPFHLSAEFLPGHHGPLGASSRTYAAVQLDWGVWTLRNETHYDNNNVTVRIPVAPTFDAACAYEALQINGPQPVALRGSIDNVTGTFLASAPHRMCTGVVRSASVVRLKANTTGLVDIGLRFRTSTGDVYKEAVVASVLSGVNCFTLECKTYKADSHSAVSQSHFVSPTASDVVFSVLVEEGHDYYIISGAADIAAPPAIVTTRIVYPPPFPSDDSIGGVPFILFVALMVAAGLCFLASVILLVVCLCRGRKRFAVDDRHGVAMDIISAPEKLLPDDTEHEKYISQRDTLLLALNHTQRKAEQLPQSVGSDLAPRQQLPPSQPYDDSLSTEKATLYDVIKLNEQLIATLHLQRVAPLPVIEAPAYYEDPFAPYVNQTPPQKRRHRSRLRESSSESSSEESDLDASPLPGSAGRASAYSASPSRTQYSSYGPIIGSPVQWYSTRGGGHIADPPDPAL